MHAVTLRRFPSVIRAITAGMSDRDARWKPASGAWSILEIICHLRDEEREDFPLRIRLTLEDREEPWPGIDPEGVAISRQYNADDLQQAVEAFATERAKNIEWLEGLADPDWNVAYDHPSIGVLRAGDLFAAWAAHDQLHLRQLARRQFELIQHAAGGFTTSYAGEWH